MPLNRDDVGKVVIICCESRTRVTYGVLGAAIMAQIGQVDAEPNDYAIITAQFVREFFTPQFPQTRGRCPTASWAVATANDMPTGFGASPTRDTPNPLYDDNWTTVTRCFNPDREEGPEIEKGARAVAKFLAWLNENHPGWDENLQSTYR